MSCCVSLLCILKSYCRGHCTSAADPTRCTQALKEQAEPAADLCTLSLCRVRRCSRDKLGTLLWCSMAALARIWNSAGRWMHGHDLLALCPMPDQTL